MTDKQLIKRATAEEMVASYQKAIEIAAEAYEMLDEAQNMLRNAFGDYCGQHNFDLYGNISNYYRYSGNNYFDKIKDRVKRGAWRSIIHRLELHKVTTAKRHEEITSRIDNDQKLPDLTVDEIMATFISLVDQSDALYKELFASVYNHLRPASQWHKLKTNDRPDVGLKVILSGYCENDYNGNFRVGYYRESDLIEIDKAFHMLDEAGIPDGYRSPLVDAINISKNGKGETKYFRFKCYQNRNLHLEMRCPGLVNKLNQICGSSNIAESAKGTRK